MSIDPNAYTSSTAGTIKLGTKSLTGSDAIDVLTGTASEVAQPLYYPQNTKSQQSDYAATDQMSNVGAALFDSSTSYQSFFDKYKNVAGGLRPLNEDFLESVYYTPEPPPDDTPPPPPPAALTPPEIPSPDAGEYGDPGMPGDPLGYDNAQVTVTPEGSRGTDQFSYSRDATLGEVGSGILSGITDLGSFLSAASTPSTIANMIEGGAAALFGRTAPAPQSFLGRMSNLVTPPAAGSAGSAGPAGPAPSLGLSQGFGGGQGFGGEPSFSVDGASYSDDAGGQDYSGIGLD